MDKDLQNLNALSVLYYVSAALTAFFSSIFLAHVGIGIAMVSGSFNEGPNPPPPFFGWLFVAIGSMAVLFGWTFAICNLLVARYLKQRKNYLFCCIIAGINCGSFPLGTGLGVFTFVVLLREPVKDLFNGVQPRELQPVAPMSPPDWR